MLSDIENLDIMLGGNQLEREGSEFAIPLGDLIFRITMHKKTMIRTAILTLGKIDRVTAPIMAITQLVQTLVRSLTDYLANLI